MDIFLLISMFTMDIFLVILGCFCMLTAFLGTVLPILPGPVIGFVGLVLLQFTAHPPFSLRFFVMWGMVLGMLTILDYIIPLWGTKKFGGTKAGVRGSMVGLIFAVVILPILGIVIGPFGILGLIAGPFL